MKSLKSDQILWEETVPGGCHWSGLMRRGSALRFTDLRSTRLFSPPAMCAIQTWAESWLR